MTLWQFIEQTLTQDTPVMLLYVVESTGSSPGRQGFGMAVTELQMQGSIGGGIMEHKLVEWARELLRAQDYQVRLKHQIHSKRAPKYQSGMICSGEQTVALVPLRKGDLRNVKHIGSDKSGAWKISSEGLSYLPKMKLGQAFLYKYHTTKDWELSVQKNALNNLYIIGGGHVGLAFSKVMADLDFRVYMYDNREDLNTMEANHYAHHKEVLPYENIGEVIPARHNSYVVVMTFGYRSDEIVMRQLIGRPFKYLGLMGSQAKIDEMWKSFKRDNIRQEYIDQVHAPIGVPIASKTPAEIAISIAAELIRAKNEQA